MTGYWTVDNSENMEPDVVDKINELLVQATEQGKQIVTVEGITLTWHEAALPTEDPLEWECPRHGLELQGQCDICTNMAFRIARASIKEALAARTWSLNPDGTLSTTKARL